MESDRLVNSFVKAENLTSEMTVVRNEFERGENSPASVLNERIHAAAFEWHNYGKSTIGSRVDIERGAHREPPRVLQEILPAWITAS